MDERIVSGDLIDFNDWNPNQMEPRIFAELVREVSEEGLDQRVVVVAKPDGRFLVVDGEHRLRAALASGQVEIPVVVKGWESEEAQKIKTVRRNNLRGEHDALRLGALVRSLTEQGANEEAVFQAMLLSKEEQDGLRVAEKKEMEKEAAEAQAADRAKTEEQVTRRVLEDATAILADLLEDGGAVGNGLCVFAFKGKSVAILSLEEDTEKQVAVLRHAVIDQGRSLNTVLREVVEKTASAMLDTTPRSDDTVNFGG